VSFHVGQLVVCVDDGNWPWPEGHAAMPKRGVVYTVRESVVSWTNGHPCVHLVEIVNPIGDYEGGVGEIWVAERRFRPVDETRLEVFRKIAASPRQSIEVDA